MPSFLDMEKLLKTEYSFQPPAPEPRESLPSALQMISIVYRNPLELWGKPAYNEPWVSIDSSVGGPMLIANDPGLIKYVLVENAKNFRMADVRQKVLRPILRNGLLTAEDEVWRRSRKALAPVFTPRHIAGFAAPMLDATRAFLSHYDNKNGEVVDVGRDMTMLTYKILEATLFSGEIASEPEVFAQQVDRLFETMGRVDPLDLLSAPDWMPRITRVLGRRSLAFFRKIVGQTMQMRQDKIDRGEKPPEDFLTLLLRAQGPDGLTKKEVEDNIITFIGAGHETTARALSWTLYCLANLPLEREKIEAEIAGVLEREPDPVKWLDLMPFTRAAFEEALRLYPPAPTINREAAADDQYLDLKITRGTQVLVMPWTIHRHNKYWDTPNEYRPSRFYPENRGAISRYQYLPFGIGPRVCIGASFAMQEAIIVLAILMSHYRFELTPETTPWPVQKLTTQPEGGLPMRIQRRD